jgi:hypothetical protein
MEKKRGRLEREVLRVVFFYSSSSTKPLSLFLSLFRFALSSPCCLFDRLRVFGFSSFPLPFSPPQSVERKNKRRRRKKVEKKKRKGKKKKKRRRRSESVVDKIFKRREKEEEKNLIDKTATTSSASPYRPRPRAACRAAPRPVGRPKLTNLHRFGEPVLGTK